MSEIDPQSDSYRVKVECGNCRFGSDYISGKAIDVPKGRPVTEYPCPHCQCFNLRATGRS